MPAQQSNQLPNILKDCGDSLVLFARSCGRASSMDPADAVQEALVRLLALRIPPEDSRAWLFRTVRNLVCSDHRRGAAARRARPLLFRAPGPDTTLDPRGVSEALSRLSHEAREVVVLKVWGRLTFEQIAGIVGLSPATAHRRFQESLTELRLQLEAPCPRTTSANKTRV